MYIEYALHDLDFNDEEIKSSLEKAVSLGVQCVSVPFALTKYTKNILKNTNIKVSNPIDYPLGILDTKTRNSAILNAINNGADKIDIVIQNNYLSNKKYDKIKADIISNTEICKQQNIPIYYYLEYRIFTHQSLIKACHLLSECLVENAYVSTGHMLDSLEDNIIAVMLLKQKTKIKTIFTGNLWHKKQVEVLDKNHIDMLRFSTINSIRIYLENTNLSR